MTAAHPARHYLPTLGLQLWTVRRELERDIPGTLRAIAQAGYAQIELQNLANVHAIARLARELGLGLTSAFLDWTALAQPGPAADAELVRTLALARELNLRYLVFGYLGKGGRETITQMRAHAAAANAFGRRCRDAGIQLCYHHHAFEFAPLDDGRTTGWDILLRDFEPDLVQFEFDVFWAAAGGLDPVQTLHDLRGRIAQVHLKDLPAGTPRLWDEHAVPPETFQEIGRGCLDWTRILAACVATGVAQCHVEQDESPDPLASIRQSIDWLRRH
ncbi:Inosose dehydratase [Lacunisphaera limnophila]|uniref:Inosose dehydratase n=1 Tax=Lacunisphaera limnophila TaxID=1838286 RepID=A0A1I7PHX2_9BACT|nr:sugar phosphate isomerase/epimerase [Lacunisphaera limnophila]AOS43220.1 Inosose dehydratase [Lacunisphaera limnophila]